MEVASHIYTYAELESCYDELNPSFTIAARHEKEASKRISTQQKIGSGHAKGPMANNVQSSVPLPVVMPFPMIPFDERYPILLTPNGKPKKGRQKKKDPKGETEDETDKDVDDENDDGDKEYKAMKPGKVDSHRNPHPKIDKTAKEGGSDGGDQSQKEAAKNAQEQLNSLLQDKEQSENDEDSEDAEEDDSGSSENDKKDSAEREDNDSNEDSADAADSDGDEDAGGKEREEGQATEEDATQQEEENESKEEEAKKGSQKTRRSIVAANNMRGRRAIYKPIIGNPEDILPYIMLGADEEEALDGQNAHQVTTRDAEEDDPPSQQAEEYDAPHDIHTREVEDDDDDDEEESHEINTRDVEEEEDEEPHVINTREVNAEEEIEEEAHNMKPRSLPDGRSYETVTYHRKFDDKVKTFAKFLQ